VTVGDITAATISRPRPAASDFPVFLVIRDFHGLTVFD